MANGINDFAQMVAPAAGYRPGMDPEHLYFGPMALGAQQAVAGTDPAAGAPAATPADRAVRAAFGGSAEAIGGASNPTATGPSVVDTTDQFDLSEGGVGAIASAALPGGSFTSGFGKLAQAVEGPYATVGRYENARPGTPQWDANMGAQRQAHNKNVAGAARRESGGVAGVASSRDITSGPSKGRGGISDRSLGRSAAERAGSSPASRSDMESERGRQSGAGGGGGSSRVICTELYRQGKLGRADWKRDLAFTAKHLTPQHVRGYHWWACAVVKELRRGRWVRFWTFWAKHRANEIAHQMGERPRGDWLGKAFRWTVEPACWVIGAFVGETRWMDLYEDDCTVTTIAYRKARKVAVLPNVPLEEDPLPVFIGAWEGVKFIETEETA